MRIKFLLFIFFIGFFTTLGAQKKVRISGTVSDSEGLALEIATVYVKGTATGAMTNDKGFYSLMVNTGDSCTLVFSCIGYNRTQKRIASAENDMNINVRLNNISLELGGITVQANRIQTNTMDRLDASKVRMMADASGGSIESLLSTFAGVSSTNELSTQYSVRGGSYDENIVYVNGIEIYRPLLIKSGQQEGLSFINPDMTSGVSFSSGGYAAQYGDKMSSVLDITYKKPEELEGSAMASMLGGNIYLGNASGKFTQVTGIRYKRATSLLGSLDTKGEYNPTFLDVQTYMSYSLSPRLEINFLGNLSANTYSFIPTNRETVFGGADTKSFKVYYGGKEEDSFGTYFGAAGLKYELHKNTSLSLQAVAFRSQEKESYDITSDYWLGEASTSEQEGEAIGIGSNRVYARNRLVADVFNLIHTGTHRFASNSLHWGINIKQEKIKDKIHEWDRRDSSRYSLPYDGETVRVFSNLLSRNEIQSSRFSAFVQDTYKFRSKEGLFSLAAGLRATYWNYNSELIVSPRASLGFVPSKNQNITLRLASGIYYQSPFYKEFRKEVSDEDGNSSIVLNKDIKSQRALHFVLGGDYGFRMLQRPFKFTAEIYYKKLDDLIPYMVNNVKISYLGENIATGYATGLDLKLFGEFVPGSDSWLSFSLMQARQEYDGKTVRLPSDQPYNISLYFTDCLPGNDRIKANMKAIWSSGLPFSSPSGKYNNDFRGAAYRRVDLGLSYLLVQEKDDKRGALSHIKNIWLGLDVFNLLDINNVDSYSWIHASSKEYAVPNYLTGRQLNLKLLIDF
ncbi:TonB-dependent receptor [Bacteroidales bacterium]|nr:TonB-dependent receptor [Bacteroidales bacterium]